MAELGVWQLYKSYWTHKIHWLIDWLIHLPKSFNFEIFLHFDKYNRRLLCQIVSESVRKCQIVARVSDDVMVQLTAWMKWQEIMLGQYTSFCNQNYVSSCLEKLHSTGFELTFLAHNVLDWFYWSRLPFWFHPECNKCTKSFACKIFQKLLFFVNMFLLLKLFCNIV